MTVATEIVIVPAALGMDDETFKKHFVLRHHDSLGGLKGFTPHVRADVLNIYRTFHDKIHETARPGQLDHEHER